jgi:sugar lactone lactonase YvrE
MMRFSWWSGVAALLAASAVTVAAVGSAADDAAVAAGTSDPVGADPASSDSVGSAPLARHSAPVISPLVSFDPALGELPESMTADDHGNLYVSLLGGFVRRITLDGVVVPIATLPLPSGGAATGIKVGPDGLIYIASASFAADPSAAFVWRVAPDTGAVELFATLAAEGFPNDLAFDDAGNLFVTDPFLGQIWRIDCDGNPVVWFSDPLLLGNPAKPAFVTHEFGVDGIAFDRSKEHLYLGNVDYGRILKLTLGGRRAPRLEVLAEDERLEGVDGIALDRAGTVYAAVNTQDRLATVDRHGHVAVLADGDSLKGPSSLVFGSGRHDRKTLYVANFDISRFQAGLPAFPGVVFLPVPLGGVPLF